MTLESALLLLLVGIVAIAFYHVQRTLLEILRTARLINTKPLSVALFTKPDESKPEQQSEPLPKVNW